jgi:hypothetical protein
VLIAALVGLTTSPIIPSADVLCQLDDDPLGAADVAEPVAVLVALQLADELSAAGSQAGDDRVDVSFRRDRWPDVSIQPEA